MNVISWPRDWLQGCSIAFSDDDGDGYAFRTLKLPRDSLTNALLKSNRLSRARNVYYLTVKRLTMSLVTRGKKGM